MEQEKALTPEQAAAILGVQVGTLAAWRYRKQGPRYYRMGANAVRYYLSDLQAYKQSVAVDPVAPAPAPKPAAPLPAWLQPAQKSGKVADHV